MVPIYQIFGTAWILPKKKRDHNAMAIHRNNRISYKPLRIMKKNTENLMKYLQSCFFFDFLGRFDLPLPLYSKPWGRTKEKECKVSTIIDIFSVGP